MVSLGASVERTLEKLYAAGDPGFREILSHAADPDDDDALAELIEMDGRIRLARGLPVHLQRYLEPVPDLERRPVALDTAIDVTLRSLSGTSHLAPGAVEALADQYPSLAGPIREAAVLAEAIWSTNALRARFFCKSRRQTPSDFGPRLPGGQARYDLRRLLGAGAGGEVYLAVDRQLSEEGHPAFVAIKLLNTNNHDPWARRRLIDEATKARRINHPNVARVLDRGVSEENEDFIVYELVSGGDLAAWYQLRAATLDLRTAVGIVARIARGVQAAHSAGLVHCDLKPGNVLITPDDEPRVTDFGIAVRAGQKNRPDGPDYPSDRPVGNLAFVSPEQYRMEEGCLSIPSDIYALGGVLFYLITGVLPNGKTLDEVRQNHNVEAGRREPPSPSEHNPRIDRTLDAICRRAMALRPENRYSSAGALADDLEAWIRREPISWTRPSMGLRVRLWATRRPALAASLALAAVSIVAGGAAAGHWWSQAAQRRQEALIQTARNEAARDRLTESYNFFAFLKHNRIEQDLLPTIMAFEAIGGKVVLGSTMDRTRLWKDRELAVRRLIEDDRRAGRQDQLESLFWQTALGLWLVNDDRYAEAEPLLNDALQRWRSRLDADDRWLAQVEILRDAAAVKRLRARASGRPDHAGASRLSSAARPSAPADSDARAATPASVLPVAAARGEPLTADERRELEDLAARLPERLEMFKGRFEDGPVHRALIVALVELNRPGLLDRPSELRKYERELRRLDHY